MGFQMRIVLLTTLLALAFNDGFCAKIPVLTALCTGSESNFYNPVIRGLSLRGHEVVSVTSNPFRDMPSNVTQISPVDHKTIYGGFGDPFSIADDFDTSLLFLDMDFFGGLCERIYENKEFQEKVLNQKFDLVMSSTLLNYCFFGLASKNNANFILMHSFPLPNYLMRGSGTHFPTSFIPYPTLPYTQKMTFFERVHNFLVDAALELTSEFSYIPKMENVYRKYLPGGENLPGIREIRQNVSLLLLNSFHTINFPRPLLPDVVEVGGLHCHPGKPLSTQLEDFISQSPDGFIYFSLGSIVQGKNLPVHTRNIFIRVFSKLKQRVLWKWEDDNTMPGLSPNVKVSKWFSQSDVLAHPKIKFFITHGGQFSIQEAMYNGVPIIGAPVFFDQFVNIKHAVNNGYALKLDIYKLKEEELEWAVTQMLTNVTYQEKASLMSKIFRDQKETPLERALYWIEYVIRHDGAPHLRSAARDLHWFQYHSLDVLLFLAMVLLATVIISLLILQKVCRSCFGPTQNENKKSKKKKRQ